jgi:hypothetical protein
MMRTFVPMSVAVLALMAGAGCAGTEKTPGPGPALTQRDASPEAIRYVEEAQFYWRAAEQLEAKATALANKTPGDPRVQAALVEAQAYKEKAMDAAKQAQQVYRPGIHP